MQAILMKPSLLHLLSAVRNKTQLRQPLLSQSSYNYLQFRSRVGRLACVIQSRARNLARNLVAWKLEYVEEIETCVELTCSTVSG
jgi:hypothetical protein